ncbi:Xaa-Pro aminopeptidase [Legionella israelensis]|uniref:Xaa-Pro aminopeptidase n=1 Tax=Legionella israelensis TaxID=454 RepID=A0AAX1ED12_9GAMM|nr:Xaa-Pro aminopeptidase [Legionella israelensis]QBR82949.1 Xaa-Pro aminopeptidase [Legionella israelensis]
MITQQEYLSRRNKLAEKMEENSIALIPAATEFLRSGDTHFRFRQNSNFYYLTGFNEPDALLVISNGKKSKSFLFNRSKNPAEEQWTGRRLGQEEAPEVLGVDEAWPIESFAEKCAEILSNKSAIYYEFGLPPKFEKQIMQNLQKIKQQARRGIHAPDTICDLTPLLSELRLFKSEKEIEIMRRAANISVEAHKQAMRRCRHLKYEYQLEAELLYEFTRQGCRGVAYDPIVGSGSNTCILHYTENNQLLKNGDLVLIDAGGEYHNYAADITRTFPVNGRFNDEQRAIYELVLRAQKAGINLIKPGVAWNEIQKTMVEVLVRGLTELGLLSGKMDELIANETYKTFYMHNSGHWLGLDVHDCGAYKIDNKWRLLEPGMVLTVEPGIYVPAHLENVDERWWNIGIRIEDDVLVTPDGHENLTAELPVEIDDIEALMRD